MHGICALLELCSVLEHSWVHSFPRLSWSGGEVCKKPTLFNTRRIFFSESVLSFWIADTIFQLAFYRPRHLQLPMNPNAESLDTLLTNTQANPHGNLFRHTTNLFRHTSGFLHQIDIVLVSIPCGNPKNHNVIVPFWNSAGLQ